MDPAAIGKLLTKPERNISAEDRERLRPILAGTKDPDKNEDGSFKVWDPREKAHTKDISPPDTLRTVSWDKARSFAAIRFHQMPLVIVGGGSSALEQDLSLLDTFPSMGVNWTLKWFSPTYLHILDKKPFRTQVVERMSRVSSQIITSKETLAWANQLGFKDDVLTYTVKDDSCGKYPSFQLAETGHDMFQHFPNSLGYALQAGVALGFKSIALVGFDFGGFHFFGDGRSVGCENHYGDAGEMKQYLRPLLMAQAHYYQLHGITVAHIGKTDLKDCYGSVGSLEEFMELVGDTDAF